MAKTDSSEVYWMPLPAGAPRHFHLLWDEDIEELRDVFKAILERSGEIVRHWYQLYVLHFGDSRSLSEPEFIRIFEPGLRHNKEALLDRDMDRYAGQVIGLGELLAERRVPLEEVIASLHLFEESALVAFPPAASTELYTSFDKLSHVRIILLVSAYFRSHAAAAGERIAALEREAAQLAHDSRTRFHGLVGSGPAMRTLHGHIEAAAGKRGVALIHGEHGTGKELIARAIHELGADASGPFIAANCAAIPADLIESELFGYRREALDGASADYLGLLRAADGGTLFIHEIGALTARMQAEALRVAREQTVRPVASADEYPVNVRIIASTSADPHSAVAQGQLHPQFFDPLETSIIAVPALRERLEDISLLADHFISVLRERSGRPIYSISDEALKALHKFNWPDNVRQLGEVIESAFVASSANVIDLNDLPRLSGPPRAASPRSAAKGLRPRLASFAELERELIERALQTTNGNKVQTARLLQISRKKLYARIRKFGLE